MQRTQTRPTANISRVEYFHVNCPACGNPMVVNGSGIGWRLWTAEQVAKAVIAHCDTCDKPVKLPDDNA